MPAKPPPPANVAPPAHRRTQADRSASTRAALADAAIEILLERGWAALTAIEACNRAGVTRGAFHHHYSSLAELLADALKRLYTSMSDTTRPAVSDLNGLMDATWAAISDRRFKGVLEAWLAMANDPSLRAEIGPVVGEFANLVRPEHLAPGILMNDEDRAVYLVVRETLLGLALGRATNRGQPLAHEAAVLSQLRQLISAHEDSRGRAGGQKHRSRPFAPQIAPTRTRNRRNSE